MELPQCNIEFTLPVPQKLRKVADRAKALEETVAQLEETLAKREEDHKVQIAKLEAHPPGTTQAEKEERIEAF